MPEGPCVKEGARKKVFPLLEERAQGPEVGSGRGRQEINSTDWEVCHVTMGSRSPRSLTARGESHGSA